MSYFAIGGGNLWPNCDIQVTDVHGRLSKYLTAGMPKTLMSIQRQTNITKLYPIMDLQSCSTIKENMACFVPSIE